VTKFLLNVGAEKTGTTWLYNYFVEHPEFVHHGKEINIIQRDDFVPRFAQDVPGVDNISLYFDFFNSRHQTTGDFTHYEGSSPNILKLIKDGLDHTVIPVYIMRDPINRAWSAWNMFGGGDVNNMPIAANFIIEKILDCKYKETVQTLDLIFGKSSSLYFFYEDFLKQENIDLICDRLEIERMPANFTPINKGTLSFPTPEFIERFGKSIKNREAVNFINKRFDNVPWNIADYQ
jgi:hypothetical protein